MATITALTDNVFIAGALGKADFSTLAARGIKTVINFRPDGESADQISAASARIAAADAGLAYVHIPTSKHELFTDEVVGAAARALQDSALPIVAHCASGQRAVIVWAAAAARDVPVADVLATLSAAGHKFDHLRDDLDAQADRARWNNSTHSSPDFADSSQNLTPLEAA